MAARVCAFTGWTPAQVYEQLTIPLYNALTEQWAEVPPLCISVMLAAGVSPAASGKPTRSKQVPGTDPNLFHEAVAHLGMKRGKPFVTSAEFDRLLKEFTGGH